MGWLYNRCWQTKADLVRHLTGPGYGGEHLRCLRHALRGNVLWTVHERRTDDGVRRFIGCFLLGRQADVGWGYKDMDESMGPCYHTCPLAYLDEVPCPDNEYARQWREQVRERHARIRAAVPVIGHYAQVGDRHMLITSLKPLRATFGGITYRLPRRYIKRVISPADRDAELAAQAAAATQGAPGPAAGPPGEEATP